MTIHVREASLIDDAIILTSLARNYLDEAADEKRFRWLYLENPFGPARTWIAYTTTGENIGMAAIFPRRMYSDRGIVTGCVLGDFCVSPDYRTVGPALQLQRSCLASAQSPEFAVAYDFPSTTMCSIYQHLGVRSIGKSVRLARVLRLDGKLQGAFRSPLVSRPATAAANFVLALKDRKTAAESGLHLQLELPPCGPEYTKLAEQVASSVGVCTVRSAEYLNWRYGQHPHVKYEFLTARRQSSLLTYCTFTVSDRSATVVELFGDMNPRLVTVIMGELVKLLRDRGIETISMPVLSSDRRINLLRRLGFWSREAAPVIGFSGKSVLSSSQMFLMHGDRES
jgi:hypothetical protein